jgi:hypothetical protein
MSKLVTNLEDLRPYVRVSSDTENIQEFTSGIDSTLEKYLLPVLGQSLLDHLEEYGNIREEQTGEDGTLEKLRIRVLRVLWPFQMAELAQELAVSVSGMGISVVRTDSVAPISDEKLSALRSSLYNRGYQETEGLIRFLITKEADYPQWTEKPNLLGQFFNYSEEFIRFVPLKDNTALQFHNLKPAIERVRATNLCELLGNDLVHFLIENLYNTQAELCIRTVLYYARCLVAYPVAVEELGLSAYYKNIEIATTSLLSTIKSNPDKFPGYQIEIPSDEEPLKFFNAIP